VHAAAADDARAARRRVAERAAAHAAAAAKGEEAASSPCDSTSSLGSVGSLRFHALLADDHPLNLRLVTRLLQLQGFEVTAVADGGAALDALRSNGHARSGEGDAVPPTPFDLAILDMNMPVLSGPDVASAFRVWEAETQPGAMRLPIIALTANVMEEHAAECASAGMCVLLLALLSLFARG
jgi:CheY-like chemotaxis protein